MLVAGPTSMNTNVAPGDTPENNSPAAMGVEARAQIYMGTPINAMTTKAINPSPHWAKNSVGI